MYETKQQKGTTLDNRPWSNIAEVVLNRTYLRLNTSTGQFETWEELVNRVLKGNKPPTEHEFKRLEYFHTNRKAMGAGRGLWFSGTDAHAKLGGAALNNCWFTTADNIENFVMAQDLLMLGGGVGLSVEHQFVSKLPKVKKGVEVVHRLSKDADFIVPDSREGWNELTRRTLESFFITGKSFSYSTLCIRGYGEIINGFGGKASGPQPFINFINTLNLILKAREGKHIRPMDAADIICATGEFVVAGNVRRSAIIILGDPWDKEYLKIKRWDLGTLPSYRALANFSVVVEDIEDLHPLFWKTYEHGEPLGIFNRKNAQTYGRMGEKKKDTAIGLNPCQPGYATVLTPSGIRTFGDINIDDIIWSGTKWTKVLNKWSTGIKPVYKYTTTTGYFLGTKNHKVVQDGEKIEVGQASKIDWAIGPQYDKQKLNEQDIMDGLVVGDGSTHKASNNLIGLHIGKKDGDYFDSEIAKLIKKYRPGVSKTFYEIETTIIGSELPKTFQRVIPNRFFFGSPITKMGFLRGLFTANGSISGNRVSLKQTSRILITQVQEMLSSLGIHSYITTNKAKMNKFGNGEYQMKESYDLNITSGRTAFKNLIGFIQKYKQDSIIESSKVVYKTSDIKSVEYIEDTEVFDITVDDKAHVYWTGGCLVSNCAEACLEDGEPCNLQEIFLPNLKDENEFIEAAVLMHRYGKRVTMEKYHNQKNDDAVKKNRRIGTGITGCLQSPLFNPKTLDTVYNAIQKENISYSKELHIPESIRTTVIKPSGTLSLLGDVTAGIHPAYSRHYIRRVRFASNDRLIPILKEAGHNIEPTINFDKSLNHNILVGDFYCEAPKNTPCADEGFDTWKQLDTLLMAQKHWADQAVSVTVYYKKEEISLIKEWLANNLKNIKSISFLCHSDHGFIQAPLEAITKEQFEKNSSKIKQLNLINMGGGELLLDDCEGGYCPIK